MAKCKALTGSAVKGLKHEEDSQTHTERHRQAHTNVLSATFGFCDNQQSTEMIRG